MSDDLPAERRPNVSAAISWAFDTFKRNPVPYIALAAVVAVIQMIQQIASAPLQAVITDCTDPKSPGQVNACQAALGSGAMVGALLTFLFIILAYFATIGIYRAALAASRGGRPEFSMIFQTEYLGRYVLFSLLNGVLVLIGVILCVIPGVIVAVLLVLGQFYVLDRGYRPIEAAKASYRAVIRNVGAAIVLVLFVLLVAIVGSAFYGILTLVTLPFSALFVVHMYRQFNGEPIA